MDRDSTVVHPSPSGLFHSLTNLLKTLVALAQTRLELISTELEEEIHRAAEVTVWAFIALLAGGIGLLFAGLTVIVAFWETHRVLAAVFVTCAFFVLSGVAVGVLRASIRRRPRLLDATRAELARDREALEKLP